MWALKTAKPLLCARHRNLMRIVHAIASLQAQTLHIGLAKCLKSHNSSRLRTQKAFMTEKHHKKLLVSGGCAV
ncbi:hypothetical protein THICB2_30097 [Thiomonas sp. CB2]|nr:hypothetical protein THICB2_30097 [Thiomonas sp. CB2]